MHALMAFALFASLSSSPRVGEPMWMRVTTSNLIAPTHVKVLVFVEPHLDNRLLTIEVDGMPLYRASDITLEGAGAKRAHLLEVTGLMPGEYVIRAVVRGPSQVRAAVERPLTVFGQ
jgi:hypothetical protein